MLRYAITDRARFVAESGQQAEPHLQSALLAQAARLTADGIDFIQLRERDLSAAALASLAHRLLATLRADLTHPAPRLLINSRADIAIATCADGVHLTSSPNELTPAQVRALYAAAALPAPIVSLSCHTLAEVANAASFAPNDRPTLLLFGPVFEKVIAKNVVAEQALNLNGDAEDRAPENSLGDKKIAKGAGLDLLRAASLAAAPIPVLALGGITRTNAAATLAAGAAGIAAIRFFQSESAQNPPQSSH
jgi:thiamine-phosphate pyrophosphorylase